MGLMLMSKMRGNPAEDDTDLVLMQLIDEVFEIIAGSIFVVVSKIIPHLLATLVWRGMVEDSIHFLEECKTHLLTIFHQTSSDLSIIQRRMGASPAQLWLNLIDGERRS